MTTVAKFGGSSLANAGRIRNAISIVQGDTARQIVVVSAPGKRDSTDTKITDLLYVLADSKSPSARMSAYEKIMVRFESICSGLDLEEAALDAIMAEIYQLDPACGYDPVRDFIVSRGEYFTARIVAAALGWTFVDAQDLIMLDEQGEYDPVRTTRAFKTLPSQQHIVVPGFYGRWLDEVKTFSRGGSDISGAIMAAVSSAKVYENWTDAPGVLVADPGIVTDPQPTRFMTYRELRELSYHGASVVHEDALAPIRTLGIPVNVLSTLNPEDPGTWIHKEIEPNYRSSTKIVGIAGKPGFIAFNFAKAGLNRQLGFYRRIGEMFEKREISIEHLPSGIDTQSIVVASTELQTEAMIEEIRHNLKHDFGLAKLPKIERIALIAVVGEMMEHAHGIAGKIFTALANAGVNVRIIVQGSSEINIIIGVAEDERERAIRAIYQAFF